MHSLTNNQLHLISASLVMADDRRIVLLDVGGRKDLPPQEHNSNVYCVGPTGQIHWQVQADASGLERDSFVWLELRDDGNIWAGRFFGNEYVVDAATGKAQHMSWHK